MKPLILAIVTASSLWTTIGNPRLVAAEVNLSSHEYLELHFRSLLHEHEDEHAINSFNIIHWFPSHREGNAVLTIIQAYNDQDGSTTNPQLRRGIRDVSRDTVGLFNAIVNTLKVRDRLPVHMSEENLVIQHVRAKDFRDILAVTIDGVTSFEVADFKRAQQRVDQAGGVWHFR